MCCRILIDSSAKFEEEAAKEEAPPVVDISKVPLPPPPPLSLILFLFQLQADLFQDCGVSSEKVPPPLLTPALLPLLPLLAISVSPSIFTPTSCSFTTSASSPSSFPTPTATFSSSFFPPPLPRSVP